MDPVPPQAPGPVPTSTGTPRGARSSAPRWLWLLVLGGFSSVFWFFLPEPAPPVLYSPWFLDQVEGGTIESVSIQGLEIRGLLREAPGDTKGAPAPSRSRRFMTFFPSEASIEPVIRLLRAARTGREPVRIETHPPQEGGMLRLILLLQSLAILAVAVVLASLRIRRA